MTRTVVLPQELSDRLDKLVMAKEEINGCLFYRRKQDFCPLEYLFATGIGTEGHVQSAPERIHVVNEFLNINPEYNFVKFHTHSTGTIKEYGDYYAMNFSQGDLAEFKSQFKDNPEYIALLATPKTKLLCGLDNPQLEIVSDFKGFTQRQVDLHDSLQKIAERLGYPLYALQAKIIQSQK